MPSPIEVFTRLLNSEIVSQFGRTASNVVVGSATAAIQRTLVTRAIRGTLDEVGIFTALEPLQAFARNSGLSLARSVIRDIYNRGVEKTRADHALSELDPDSVIPLKATSRSTWAFSREYKYNFRVRLKDNDTGKTVLVTRSMVSDELMSPSEAEDEFESDYDEGYSRDNISIVAVELISVERRREPLI